METALTGRTWLAIPTRQGLWLAIRFARHPRKCIPLRIGSILAPLPSQPTANLAMLREPLSMVRASSTQTSPPSSSSSSLGARGSELPGGVLQPVQSSAIRSPCSGIGVCGHRFGIGFWRGFVHRQQPARPAVRAQADLLACATARRLAEIAPFRHSERSLRSEESLLRGFRQREIHRTKNVRWKTVPRFARNDDVGRGWQCKSGRTMYYPFSECC